MNVEDQARTSSLKSKLFPGVGAYHPIARPRLAPPPEVLDGRIRVSAITGPAGYGKSTLMAHWFECLHEAGAHCAWLSLDENDNDDKHLLACIIEALRSQNPRIGGQAAEQMAADSSLAAVGVLLQSLAQDLDQARQRLVLFLDDLHYLHARDSVRIVRWLVKNTTKSLQFVLGGRDLSSIKLGDLSTHEQVYEIDQHQLAFDMLESESFYLSRLGRTLSKPELARLMQKTEGWPTGLQIAALALLDETPGAGQIDAFTGADYNVVDYLNKVVLEHLGEEDQRFLYLCAQFERISGALAKAASGLSDAAERLVRMHARGLFLIALDPQGEWFRFHHLAGDCFRRHPPAVLADPAASTSEALFKGACWLYENGLIEEAIDCAIRARKWQQACDWISMHLGASPNANSHHQWIQRWMRSIPKAWSDRYPLIQMHYMFSLTFQPQRRLKVQQKLDAIDQLCLDAERQKNADPVMLNRLHRTAELLRGHLSWSNDDRQKVRDISRDWLARYPDAPPMLLGTGENLQAVAHMRFGEIEQGLKMVAQARDTFLSCKHYHGLGWNAIIETLLHLRKGDYHAAFISTQKGIQILSEHLGGGGTLHCLFHAIKAFIAYELDNIPLAYEELGNGLINFEEIARADCLILALLTQARLSMLKKNEKSSFAVLHSGQAFAQSQGLHRVEISLAAEECIMLSRLSRWDEARAVAKRYGFDRSAAPALPHTLTSDKWLRAGSRIALMDEPKQVADAMRPAIADARQRGLVRREIVYQFLRAAALHKIGRTAEGRSALAAASHLGHRHGYRRLFLDDAELLKPMLAQDGGNNELVWLREMLTQSAPSAKKERMDGITTRELHILGKLESGLNNREIAESLFISEGTLKWHLHNVYGKLGVRNRSGAIVRAKQLKLFDSAEEHHRRG